MSIARSGHGDFRVQYQSNKAFEMMSNSGKRWRWFHDGGLNFPKPIYIDRRRYRREADGVQWLNAQAVVAKDAD
jgi:hypothetical protein